MFVRPVVADQEAPEPENAQEEEAPASEDAAPAAQEEAAPAPKDAAPPETPDDSDDFDDISGDDSLDDDLDDLDALIAGDDISGDDGGAEAPSILREWKGFAQARPRIFLRERGRETNDQQLLLEAELELTLALHEQVELYFRPRVFVDALDNDLRRFEPLEGYASVSLGPVGIRVGQLIENWGVVDTFNPLDVLNRRDFARDILDPSNRLGELGARVQIDLPTAGPLGEPTVALYVLPTFRQTPFGGEHSPYGFGEGAIPFNEDKGYEPSGEHRWFYGARVTAQLNTTPIDFDLQLVATWGPSRTPLVVLRGGELVPAYYGTLVLGGGLRAVPNQAFAGDFLSKLTFKAEVAYHQPYENSRAPINAPEEFVALVVGVDRVLAGLFSDVDQLTLTAEYAREDGASDFASDQRAFRNDAIFRLFWEANDFARTSVELRGLFDLDHHEFVIEGVFERQLRFLHEDLRLVVNGQYFESPRSGTPFSQLRNLTNVSLALRWEF